MNTTYREYIGQPSQGQHELGNQDGAVNRIMNYAEFDAQSTKG